MRGRLAAAANGRFMFVRRRRRRSRRERGRIMGLLCGRGRWRPLRLGRRRSAITLRCRRRISLSWRRRISLSWWRRISLSWRRRVRLSWWRRIGLSRRRCVGRCGRRPVRVLRRGLWRRLLAVRLRTRRARSEVRADRGTERVHPFRRAEARAVCGRGWREATRVWRCGIPRGLRRASVTGGRGRRRTGPRLRRGRCAVRLRSRSGLAPSGRGLRLSWWLRLRSRRGGRGSTIARWRRCRGGQRIAARQAEFAGGLVRRAAPRAHVHV